MPNAYIKKLADEGKGSVDALEKKWNKAKAIAAGEGHKDDYGYITGIFKKMINEGRSLKDMLKRKAIRFTWDKDSSPKQIENDIKKYSDEELISLLKNTEGVKKHSERDIQIRLIKRELKRRYNLTPKGNLKESLYLFEEGEPSTSVNGKGIDNPDGKKLGKMFKRKKKKKDEDQVEESFSNKIRPGKIPIGSWAFKYTLKGNKVGFLERSAKAHNLNVIKKGSNFIVAKGEAKDHVSLINSLQSFRDIYGEVVDWDK